MRTLLVIATASLFAAQYGFAQQKTATATPTPPGLECFEHMVNPEFPAAARAANVDGSVWTWTQVTAQGAGNIDTKIVAAYSDQASKLLKPAVEKALKESQFKSQCVGKTVEVVFRYQIDGEAVANPTVTAMTTKPNTVTLSSAPLLVTTAAARRKR